MRTKKIRVIREFKTLVLTEEEWRGGPSGIVEMEVYRNKNGDYVDARQNGKRPGLVKFIEEKEITPELAGRTHTVCSVGKSAKDGKWYGWSHRALVGFGIGDRIFEENYGDDNTPFVKHGRETIKTDADARKAAVAFARSVS